MEPHIHTEKVFWYSYFLYLLLMLWQVETVAQFGVVFLLFALGLEFSMTKVGIYLLLTNLNTISCRLCNLTLIICCSCINATAESRWPSCCPWRASSNCLTHVFVWCNCLGMAKDFSICAYTAILKLFLELISHDMCSCVEQGCQRVFLLVPFYLCHQLQWYFFLSFFFSSLIQKHPFSSFISEFLFLIHMSI